MGSRTSRRAIDTARHFFRKLPIADGHAGLRAVVR
jgi:hypothetical protein